MARSLVQGARSLGRRRPATFAAAVIMGVALLAGCQAPGSGLEIAGYRFLDSTMDMCGAGSAPRLPPSYPSEAPSDADPPIAYTYDVALTVLAYLDRGRDEDVSRAQVLGDVLAAAVRADSGGLRTAYECEVAPGEPPVVVAASASTGNVAWAGLALLALDEKEGGYLDEATKIAEWIAQRADVRGAGGFTGGFTEEGEEIAWKSTEHNIDVAAFFQALGRAGVPGHDEGASSAARLVDAAWDERSGHFWVGVGDDGITLNKGDYVPEDVQSWAVLALDDARYQDALTWTLQNLAVTDGEIAGVKVGDGEDPKPTVWLEGTAHAAAALACRDRPGDEEARERFLASLRTAQDSSTGAIPAASRDGTAGGDGEIAADAHVGTTAWYLLAERGANPFGGACNS